MKIQFDEKNKIFQLSCKEMAYAFAITDNARIPGGLMHLYWGAPVQDISDYEPILKREYTIATNIEHPCKVAEYSHGNVFDFGTPCLKVLFANGAETLRLQYACHTIEKDCLRITLKDSFYPIEVELIYKTWDNLPLISRSAVIYNKGTESFTLLTAKSGTLHLPHGRDYRLTHYSGFWGAEYQKNQTPLTHGKIQLDTNRLTNAAQYHLPFFALDENGTATESTGDVYFGFLEYSGDFQLTVETQREGTFRNVRVTAGISDETAHIALKPGERFQTPALTYGYSNRGFERMSEIFYDWEFDYILPRGEKTDKAHGVRPIIYNTWYPYHFEIDEEKLIGFIPKAKYIGAELYVIDDGWMPNRVNEFAGLGDWIVDKKRFPHGLKYIADEVHKAGMLFGIWIEPEMVNPDSDLYRTHPDWVLGEPNRDKTLMRQQLILDMSRDDVTDWAIEWLEKFVEENGIDYLKWDMNREVTEKGLYSVDNALAIKYIQNVERIWKHLNKRFPDLLLENCAAGGGRADFNMLKYADRVNRSDNADPIDVMVLHEGYSTFFVPKLAGGAGNVAPLRTGINGRSVPLSFRVHSGMTGSMSVGINLLQCSQEELDALKNILTEFKKVRPALQDAYVYRIASALEKPYAVFQYVKRDRSQFSVFAFGHNIRYWDAQLPLFRMRGLIPEATYVCGDVKMSGSALMNVGIDVSLVGDYDSKMLTFVKEEK